MFFCICKAVTESRVDELVQLGLSAGGVQARCGAGTKCGSCLGDLRKKIEAHRASRRVPELDDAA